MKANIKTIREAVEKNCGGFSTADDAAIMSKWESLTDETQKQYLDSIKKGAKDVAGS